MVGLEAGILALSLAAALAQGTAGVEDLAQGAISPNAGASPVTPSRRVRPGRRKPLPSSRFLEIAALGAYFECLRPKN